MSARQLILGVAVTLGGEVQKCQNSVCDLDFDLENKVKVLRSRNFEWPYLRDFATQDEDVCCSENACCLLSV